MKRFNTIASIVNTGLITLTVFTEGISIAAIDVTAFSFYRFCCHVLTKEQREELLEQGRKEGKECFL